MLWAIWDASGLAGAVAAGSPRRAASAGAAADRDLDAVLALFDKAAHFTETMPPGSPGLFADSLAGQEIVGDTLAERARPRRPRVPRPDRPPLQGPGVGSSWWSRASRRRPGPTCVCAGPCSGRTSSRRPPGPVSGADSQGADVESPAMLSAKLLAEERRLFYVAATRARRAAMVVTAAGGEDTDQRPSRFLTELAGDDIPIERVTGGGTHRWLSLPALVADLRRAAADTARPPALSARRRRRSWPGWPPPGSARQHPRERVRADRAVRGRPDRGGRGGCPAVPVPGSSRSPGAVVCAGYSRWRSARGRSDVLRSPGHGHPRRGGTRPRPARPSRAVADRIDEIWHHLDFGSAWYSAKAAGAGRADGPQVPRLAMPPPTRRELVAVEQPFKVRIGQVEITGKVDRLESDPGGPRGRGRPGRPAAAHHGRTSSPAIRSWACTSSPSCSARRSSSLGLAEPGGAELVQVGKAAGVTMRAKVQRQEIALADDADPAWAKDLVENRRGRDGRTRLPGPG